MFFKNLKLSVIAFLVLLWGFSISFALPGSPVETHYLENRMMIMTKEDHSKNLIAMCIYVKGGSRTETPELSGLSHYYEHLIFRGGTEKQKELETRKMFRSLGTFFGFTSNDVTCYYIVTPQENFDEALWRYADVVMDLVPDQKRIERERQIILEEIYMYRDRPDYRVWDLLEENAYKSHPYKRPVIGFEEVVKKADLNLLKTFYEERYVPNQMVMAVVGNFDTPRMMEKIKGAFGSYSKGGESFELGISELPQTQFTEIKEKMRCSSSYLLLGYHIPEAKSEDIPLLNLVSTILTDGKSSRLQKRLKVEKNLVFSVKSYVIERKDPGLFVLDCQIDPGVEKEVVEIIFEELKRFSQDEISKAELEKAKKKIENSYYYDNQTYISQAKRLCHYGANSNILLEASYLERISNATASDIKEVVSKYLGPANATLAVVMPENREDLSFKEIASKYGFEKPISEEKVKKTQKIVLENGLTMILKEDHSSKTIALEGYVKGGLWVEDPQKNGIASFVSKTIMKGTRNYSAKKLPQIIDSLGIEIFSKSFADYTEVGLLSTLQNLNRGLEIFSEVLFYPVFPQEEVEKVREDILTQIQSIPDRSYDLTNKEFAKTIFDKSPYSLPILGEKNTITNILKEDLLAFHKKVYVPSNVILAVVGDFELGKMKKELAKVFSDLTTVNPVDFEIVNEFPQREKKIKSIPADKTQITFNLGRMGVGVTHPDYFPLKLVERILGSKLFFKYVYEKGMAYRMWTYLRPTMGSSPFTFEMGVSPENFEKAYKGILGEVKNLIENPISEKDLEVAKKNLLTDISFAQEKNSGTARYLAFYEMVGKGYGFAENYSVVINRVTKEKATQVAKKYLDPDKYTLVIVGKDSE